MLGAVAVVLLVSGATVELEVGVAAGTGAGAGSAGLGAAGGAGAGVCAAAGPGEVEAGVGFEVGGWTGFGFGRAGLVATALGAGVTTPTDRATGLPAGAGVSFCAFAAGRRGEAGLASAGGIRITVSRCFAVNASKE